MEYLSRRKNLAAMAYLVGGAGLAAAQSPKKVGGPQPEMEAALEHLKEARDNLEKASHDKGGHRTKAVDLIKQAIAEVNAGIEYAHQHP